jgi:hypothetical protein
MKGKHIMTVRKISTKPIAGALSTFVGVDGELFYDTVTNELKISDGSTAGGVTLNTTPLFLQLPVYANSTARDAAITAPVQGMIVFNASTKKFEGYNATTWAVLNP